MYIIAKLGLVELVYDNEYDVDGNVLIYVSVSEEIEKNMKYKN